MYRSNRSLRVPQDSGGSGLDNSWSKTRDEGTSSWFYNSAGWGERK